MSVNAPAEAPFNDALIASDVAGRLRIRLRREARTQARMAAIAQSLRGRPGISGVEANSRTGSVTITYDPRTHTRDDILGMLRDQGVTVAVAPDVATQEDGLSTTGELITQGFSEADRWLSDVSRMQVDLKVAFPLALFGIGVWRTFAEGLSLSRAPAYVMFWYAFSAFVSLNKRRPPHEHA